MDGPNKKNGSQFYEVVIL